MKRMKILESNVKCGETLIFDHKFYFYSKSTKFPSNFVPSVRILSKDLSVGWGFLTKNLVAQESAWGVVTC